MADQPNPMPIDGRESPQPLSVPKPAAEDAEQAARKVLELSPGNIPAQLALAEIDFRRGRLEQAEGDGHQPERRRAHAELSPHVF